MKKITHYLLKNLMVKPSVKDKKIIIYGILSYFIVLLLSHFVLGDYSILWEKLIGTGVKPSFADLRALTAGWDVVRQGQDPLIVHPYSYWGIHMNYPRIWQYLVVLGLGDKQTIPIAITIVICFGATIWYLCGKVNRMEAIIYLLFLLSPANMLIIARGNNDIIIFIILGISSIFFYYKPIKYELVGNFFYLLAISLKLFPIFGIFALASTKTKKDIIKIGIILSLFVVYLFLTRHDLLLISQGTHRPTQNAFGIFVLADEFAKRIGNAQFLHILSIVCLITLLLGTFILAYRNWQHISLSYSHEQWLFCMGAGIYCGVFIFLGNSYDYRLIFLLFTMPQLFIWAKTKNVMQSIGLWVIILIPICFWIKRLRIPIWDYVENAFISNLLKTGIYSITFFIKDSIHWFLLFAYLYALLLITFKWFNDGKVFIK